MIDSDCCNIYIPNKTAGMMLCRLCSGFQVIKNKEFEGPCGLIDCELLLV